MCGKIWLTINSLGQYQKIPNPLPMNITKNILLPGAAGLPISLDIFFLEGEGPKPVLLYVHGFNGFKDWGNFDLMAAPACNMGFVLVKFNFSHNGTSPEAPESFVNLEAFGQNNYSKQLSDLKTVVDWVADPDNVYAANINPDALCLLGHSMGGGISILFAAGDSRIKKLVTWASISECKTPWGNWPGEKMDEWKRTGVRYYLNSRTAQQMPLYYQLYEDYIQHQKRLDIKTAISGLQIPILICHGTNDAAVPIEKANDLHSFQPNAKLFTVDSDHVFGRKHPWPDKTLPAAMQTVLEKTLQFFNQ